MFVDLKDMLKFFSTLDLGDIVFDIIQNDALLQETILDLNREGQLFNKGIDSKGVKLSQIGGDYSPFTLQKGGKRRADLIDLFDTGDFYASFRLIVSRKFIEITADPIKEDTNLFEEWGEDIVGLTEQSKEILVNILLPKIENYINARI